MADAVMSGAAGKVLGPRPGKAACSFKQGVVEVMLRVINAVSKRWMEVHVDNIITCIFY